MPMEQLEIKSFPWTPVCDICGEEGFDCADDDELRAKDETIKAGWIVLSEKTYCPECVSKARMLSIVTTNNLLATLSKMEDEKEKWKQIIQEERRGKAYEF